MPIPLKALIVISALVLTGCAATVERTSKSESRLAISQGAAKSIVLTVSGSDLATTSEDWEKLRQEWREAMKDAAEKHGMAISYQESSTEVPQKNQTLVVIKVIDYRYVSQGARFMFGIMTGNAFVDADVSFFELPSKTPVGTRNYKTSSSAGGGIFAPMISKQIQSISGEIVREITHRQ